MNEARHLASGHQLESGFDDCLSFSTFFLDMTFIWDFEILISFYVLEGNLWLTGVKKSR